LERQQRADESSQLRNTLDDLRTTTDSRIAELESQLGLQSRARASSEFRVKELERELESTTADRERLLIDAKESDVEYRNLIQRNSALEREKARLEATSQALEQQVCDKDATLQRSSELLKAADDSKANSEEKVCLILCGMIYYDLIPSLTDLLLNPSNGSFSRLLFTIIHCKH
jgi:hypothetical protein